MYLRANMNLTIVMKLLFKNKVEGMRNVQITNYEIKQLILP